MRRGALLSWQKSKQVGWIGCGNTRVHRGRRRSYRPYPRPGRYLGDTDRNPALRLRALTDSRTRGVPDHGGNRHAGSTIGQHIARNRRDQHTAARHAWGNSQMQSVGVSLLQRCQNNQSRGRTIDRSPPANRNEHSRAVQFHSLRKRQMPWQRGVDHRGAVDPKQQRTPLTSDLAVASSLTQSQNQPLSEASG